MSKPQSKKKWMGVGIGLFLVVGIFGMYGLAGAETTNANIPLVTLEVPIGTTKQVHGIAEYVSIFYRFAVSAVAIIAAAMIMYAGISWLTAAGNSQRIGEAKERIIAAISGLIVTLLSFVILNTINPKLVQLQNPGIPEVALEEGASLSESGISSSAASTGECKSKGQVCLGDKYSYVAEKDKTEMETHLVSVTFDDGLGHSHSLRVHEDAKSIFEAVFNNIKVNNIAYSVSNPSLEYAIDFGGTGTYNWRANANNAACLSSHSFGFAIDINPNENPNCPSSSTCFVSEKVTSDYCATYTASNGGATTCDMPDWFINNFTGNSFSWGGGWNSLRDYMHFEYIGHGCGLQ